MAVPGGRTSAWIDAVRQLVAHAAMFLVNQVGFHSHGTGHTYNPHQAEGIIVRCFKRHHGLAPAYCLLLACWRLQVILFSVPYWLCEFAGFVLSNAFVISLWNQIDRPERRIADMLAPSHLPAVDVYIATYSGALLLEVLCRFQRSMVLGRCAVMRRLLVLMNLAAAKAGCSPFLAPSTVDKRP